MSMEQQLAVISQQPAYAMAEAPSDFGAGISVGFPSISIKQSIFRIRQGDTETPIQDRFLDIILVAARANISKTFYMKKWQPGDKAEAPDCSSLDGVTPDQGVSFPQSASCTTCPQNQWGSRITEAGKQARACSDGKRVVVLPASNPQSDFFLLNVPPASLKALASYAGFLDQHRVKASAMITRMEFDLSVDYPCLKFSALRYLDEQSARFVESRMSEPMIQTILGPTPRAAAVTHQIPPAPAYAQVPPAVQTTGYMQPVQAPVQQPVAPAQPPANPFATQAAPAVQPVQQPAQAPANPFATQAPPVQQPVHSAVSAFGATPQSAASPVQVLPNGGEIMPPEGGEALGAAVGNILDQFDD